MLPNCPQTGHLNLIDSENTRQQRLGLRDDVDVRSSGRRSARSGAGPRTAAKPTASSRPRRSAGCRPTRSSHWRMRPRNRQEPVNEHAAARVSRGHQNVGGRDGHDLGGLRFVSFVCRRSPEPVRSSPQGPGDVEGRRCLARRRRLRGRDPLLPARRRKQSEGRDRRADRCRGMRIRDGRTARGRTRLSRRDRRGARGRDGLCRAGPDLSRAAPSRAGARLFRSCPQEGRDERGPMERPRRRARPAPPPPRGTAILPDRPRPIRGGHGDCATISLCRSP